MNKKRLFTTAVLLFALAAALFAQEEGGYKKRDVYTKTFPIAKVWSSSYGYRVDYVTSGMDLRSLYIKMDHFTGSAGKAVLVYGRGPEYPYLSVTWIAGKIDHVTIYAVENMAGLTWGVLHGGDELKSKFPDDIVIKF